MTWQCAARDHPPPPHPTWYLTSFFLLYRLSCTAIHRYTTSFISFHFYYLTSKRWIISSRASNNREKERDLEKEEKGRREGGNVRRNSRSWRVEENKVWLLHSAAGCRTACRTVVVCFHLLARCDTWQAHHTSHLIAIIIIHPETEELSLWSTISLAVTVCDPP